MKATSPGQKSTVLSRVCGPVSKAALVAALVLASEAMSRATGDVFSDPSTITALASTAFVAVSLLVTGIITFRILSGVAKKIRG